MEKKSHKATRNGNIIVAGASSGISTGGSAVAPVTTLSIPTRTTGHKQHTPSGSVVAATGAAGGGGVSSSGKHRSSNSGHHYHSHHTHITSHPQHHQHTTHTSTANQTQEATQVQHSTLHAPNPAILLAVGKAANEASRGTKVTGTQVTNAMEHIATALTTVSPKLATTAAMRNKNEEAINDLRQRIPEIENIFDVHSRIGNGTFSTVLLGTLKKERGLPEHMRRKFAIKHHIPTSHPDRIMKELQCMAKIGGTDNVVGINCCIRYNESVAFIMPYMQHDRFHDFFNKMELSELQHYMRNLLIALRHVHKFNVIHRDVKPSNFLYNRRKRQFLLVDFGLAQQVPTSHVANTLEGGCEQPLSLAMGSEGKRPRDGEDSASNRTADSNGSVAAGDAYGGSKRPRCTGPHGDQEFTANATPNARVANSCIVGGSPFKMPLKQLNEITATGGNKTSALGAVSNLAMGSGTNATNHNNNAGDNGICEAQLGRQVKSAILGSSASTRLQQKLRQSGGGMRSPNSAAQDAAATGSNAGAAQCMESCLANKYNTNRNMSVTNGPKCVCYGNPQVCNICLVKKEMHASRAGTPGYRPPEVLLKYADQTTAVDIWAAGVIFLSILSSVYPFFKAPNDFVALAEMVTIFGDKTIRKTAFILDRLVTLSQKTRPLDLRKLCVRFRNRVKFSSPELLKKYQRPDGTCEVCRNCDQFYFNCLCTETNYNTEPLDGDDPFPASAYDLLYKLLEVNPHQRITADEALKHPFFSEMATTSSSQSSSVTSNINNNNNNNVNRTAISIESTQKKGARDKVEP
ncbi:cell division cycle 7-related protein kinase-like [Rhagoletis pomonella]|uniref:cell division cycle 7-related protein kinase-like n=1 Tax=Rhagoletis pomonella TaxID=28610 RepID=UPI001783997F|nr:cell division cycle 7-related protein kinase-like [Rhagoletis pomonella]